MQIQTVTYEPDEEIIITRAQLDALRARDERLRQVVKSLKWLAQRAYTLSLTAAPLYGKKYQRGAEEAYKTAAKAICEALKPV